VREAAVGEGELRRGFGEGMVTSTKGKGSLQVDFWERGFSRGKNLVSRGSAEGGSRCG